MKKFMYIWLLGAVMMTLSSCEGDFDAKIYGTLSTTNFPNTSDDYENYLMDMYIPFCSQWSYTYSGSSYTQRQWYCCTGGIVKYFDQASDIMAVYNINKDNVKSAWGDMPKCNFENFKYVARKASDEYPNHFEKIREISRFTVSIQTLEDADASKFTGNKKAELVGEARLLRGLMMYYMMHVFGPVPVILDASLVGNSAEEAKLVRPSLDEMTQYITADFEYAVENMAETQSEKGRYNRDFARFCLMHHYLNEGYHMDGYYQKAYSLYSQFKGSYKLFDSGTNPYVDLFKESNDFNSEIIMALSCSTDGTGSAANGNMNCWTYYCYPKNVYAVDENGNNIDPFCNQNRGAGAGWGQYFSVNKSFYDSFEAGDLRKEAIITRFRSKSFSDNNGWVTPDDLGTKWDGYIANKYYPESATTQYQGNDIALARWADVLLMYAEADVRLNNTVSQSAISCVNQVRNRAGLANLTADKTSSVSAFLDALLEERAHELWFEGFRKIDLIRFGKYYTTMSALGRTPTSEYIPIPDYAVEQAKNSGYELKQYFTRDNYDGPKL